jgi:hypothetical protein
MTAESERAIFWSRHWAAWQSSGLSQRAYCQQQGLSYSAFGYWRNRLNRVKSAAIRPPFVPLLIEPPAVEAGGAESVAPIHCGRGTGVEIRLVHGRSIVVDADFDEAVLARVIRVMEQVPC